MQIDPDNVPDHIDKPGGKRARLRANITPADHPGATDHDYTMFIENFNNGSPGTSHFFGAGQSGAPGVTQYPDWKPPDPVIAKHNKSFYIELENSNFINVDSTTDANLFLPYYLFPYQYIPWYLSTGEYNWYVHSTCFARIKSTRFQVNVVGHRLPFTTNDETASVANSQVDQTLDVFRAIEKKFPFDVYNTNVRINSAYDLQTLFTRLYENHKASSPNNAAKNIPANMGYRRWNCRPAFNIGQTVTGGADFTNTIHTYPSLAESKYMSADLRQFRGPLIEVCHQTKNGIISQPHL